jgi:hypothetical protein
MYKILLQRRGGTEPLFTYYTVSSTEDTTLMQQFSTNDLAELQAKVEELLQTVPAGQIVPIADMGYVIDVLINDV